MKKNLKFIKRKNLLFLSASLDVFLDVFFIQLSTIQFGIQYYLVKKMS